MIAALFGCLLLHSFVLTSTAGKVPSSDLPFEFNYDKGSTITEHNVLTQSVSSDGQTVLKANDPQPIVKYQGVKKNSRKSTKNQNSNKNQQINNNSFNGAIKNPAGHSSTSYYSTSPMMDQLKFFENFSKYIPGFSNMRIEYI